MITLKTGGMDSVNAIGHKVTLKTTDNLLLSGFIQYVDVGSNKLTLREVKDIVSGKSVQGLQHFFRRDILELEVHEERKEHLVQQVNVTTTARADARCPRSSSIKSKGQHDHLKHLKCPRSGQTPFQTSDQEEKRQRLKSGEERISSTRYRLPHNCTLVDDSNSQLFRSTVRYFCQQAAIAVSFQGVSLGRSGKLCWMLVASREETVFFDILTMGKQAMDSGIKSLLESSSVLKVIHDCRLPSDLLYHQYGIRLHNVFDTQVASAFVYKRRKGDFPQCVETLGHCLLTYLQLKKDDIHFMLLREHCQQEDEKVWMDRPEPVSVCDAAYQHVRHLLNLRLVLVEEMMIEFNTGVDIYLGNVRDASESEARSLEQAKHRLPLDFANLSDLINFDGRQKQSSRNMTKGENSKTFNVMDSNSLEENCKRVVHPAVYGTDHSTWPQSNGERSLLENSSVDSASPLTPCKNYSSSLVGKQCNYPFSQKKGITELANGKHNNASLRKDNAMHSTSDSEESFSRELLKLSPNGKRDNTAGSRDSCMNGYSRDDPPSSIAVNSQDHSKEELLESRCSERSVDISGQLFEDSFDPISSPSHLEQNTLAQINPRTLWKDGCQTRYEDESKIEQKSAGLDILRKFMKSREKCVSREDPRTSKNIIFKSEGAFPVNLPRHKRPSRKKCSPVTMMDDYGGGLSESSLWNQSVGITGQPEEGSFDAIPSQLQLEQKDRKSLFVGDLSAALEHILCDHLGSVSGGFDVTTFRDVTPQDVKGVETSDYKQSFLAEILPTTQGDPELKEGRRPWLSCRRSTSVSPSHSSSSTTREAIPGDCLQDETMSFRANESTMLLLDLECPHIEGSPTFSMCALDSTDIPAASLIGEKDKAGSDQKQDCSQLVKKEAAEMPSLCLVPIGAATTEKVKDNTFCLSSNILEALGHLHQWKEPNARILHATSDECSGSPGSRQNPSESLHSLLGLSLSPQEHLRKTVSKAANIISV